MVVFIMPLTDLPLIGALLVVGSAVITAVFLIPYNFFDTFILSIEKSYKDESKL